MSELLTTIKKRLPRPIPIGMFYPELSEDDIAAFERKHSIQLPAGYQRFLLELGDGGEGPPAHGIVPLGTGSRRSDAEEVAKWVYLPYVALPFPFTRPWIWEGGEVSVEGTLEQVDHGSIFLGEDGEVRSGT